MTRKKISGRKPKARIKFYVDAANPELLKEKPSNVAEKFGISIIVCGKSRKAFNRGDEVFVDGPAEAVREFVGKYLVIQ